MDNDLYNGRSGCDERLNEVRPDAAENRYYPVFITRFKMIRINSRGSLMIFHCRAALSPGEMENTSSVLQLTLQSIHDNVFTFHPAKCIITAAAIHHALLRLISITHPETHIPYDYIITSERNRIKLARQMPFLRLF